MDATQYSDGSTYVLSSYSSKRSTVASSLAAVRIICATAELSGSVLEACASLVYATMRGVLFRFCFAVQMVLYVYCDFALGLIVSSFGLPFRIVWYCLKLNQCCTHFAVLFLYT